MSAIVAESETPDGTSEPQPAFEDVDIREDETQQTDAPATVVDSKLDEQEDKSILPDNVEATAANSGLSGSTDLPIQSNGVPLAGPDPNAEESKGQQIVSNGTDNSSSVEEVKRPELLKDEGSRTFTMRELLTGLKNVETNDDSEAERQEVSSPYGQDSPVQQQIDPNSATMELINSVTTADEEGRSRQRILTFAAKRYASALDRNPEDYDALYNWALVLQESADNVSPDSGSSSKDALLEEACKKYDEATHLCPTLHDAFYNWAIAISDRAKMRGRTKEAEELWKQATKNYEKAVELNWNSPQALNNWGLALQELSAIVPAREKQIIVKTAISKFRAAIQLQFDFHRAIYNLGTVLYGLAEDTSRIGGSVSTKDVSPNELYSQSAIYIAAAHALKPSYSVYTSALKLVRSMLPLPYLKVGHLIAPPVGSPIAPHCDWKLTQFVLNHEGLEQLHEVEHKQSRNVYGNTVDPDNNRPAIKVDIPDIVSVSACADLTLPPGAGLCIHTIHGPVYLVTKIPDYHGLWNTNYNEAYLADVNKVADSWEAMDGWLDAIRLVYTIFARGKSDVLAGIISG